jgi:hypothetical protein
MNSDRDLILKILEAIEYPGDKNKCADDFLENIQMQALVGLLQSLPISRQNEIKTYFSQALSPQDQVSYLQKYFSPELVQTALKNASKKIMTDYLEGIQASLSFRQKQNLKAIF